MTHEALAAYLMIAGAGVLVAGLVEWRIRRVVLRKLDQHNGYFRPDQSPSE